MHLLFWANIALGLFFVGCFTYAHNRFEARLLEHMAQIVALELNGETFSQADSTAIAAIALKVNFPPFLCRWYWSKGSVLDPNTEPLQTFPSPLGTLHSAVNHAHKLWIASVSHMEYPRHYIICHYITAHKTFSSSQTY